MFRMRNTLTVTRAARWASPLIFFSHATLFSYPALLFLQRLVPKVR
nr:MAG TPA: hypothetical protein [Caudoviricetes sp.]